MTEQEEIFEAVDKANEKFYEKYGDNQPILCVTVAQFITLISISIGEYELHLYNSEEDDRIWYEDSCKYEEWYSYLRRKFREVKSKINSYKL